MLTQLLEACWLEVAAACLATVVVLLAESGCGVWAGNALSALYWGFVF